MKRIKGERNGQGQKKITGLYDAAVPWQGKLFPGGVGVAGAFNLGRVYWGSVPALCPGADVPAGRKLWVAARQSHRDLQQPPN